jgi:hypothetical protein
MKRLNRISASRYDNVPGYKAPEGGYLYIFKHGIGPGTMPSDVHIVKVKDLPNYYTAVWLSDFLTTDELKKYDIPDETRINSILDRIGYCQKNGDVVPCDDSNTWEGYSLDACDDITAATTSNRYTIKSVSDEGTYYLVKDWRKNRALWVSKENMNRHPEWWFTSSGKAKQSLKSLLSVMDEYLSDTFTVVDMSGNETPLDVKELGFDHIPEYWDDDVEACNAVTASTIPTSDIKLLAKEALNCNTRDELSSVIGSLQSIDKKLYLHYMELFRDNSLSVAYIASQLSDELMSYYVDDIDACNDVMASEDDEDKIYWIQAYYSKPHKGLADDFATNDWDAAIDKLVEFANQGYYIAFDNLASGDGRYYDPDEVLEAVDFGDIYELRGLANLCEG